jgi:hypothetical protein
MFTVVGVIDVAYLTHSTRDAANSPAQCVEVVPTELTAINLLNSSASALVACKYRACTN